VSKKKPALESDDEDVETEVETKATSPAKVKSPVKTKPKSPKRAASQAKASNSKVPPSMGLFIRVYMCRMYPCNHVIRLHLLQRASLPRKPRNKSRPLRSPRALLR
jgi:hypothetical protein